MWSAHASRLTPRIPRPALASMYRGYSSRRALPGGHPIQVVREPLLQAAHLRRKKRARLLQYRHGADDLHKMNRVDDPDSTPGSQTMNCLGILKVRVHPRGWVKKPCAQVLRTVRCVSIVACEQPRRSQSRNLNA